MTIALVLKAMITLTKNFKMRGDTHTGGSVIAFWTECHKSNEDFTWLQKRTTTQYIGFNGVLWQKLGGK